MKNIVLIILVLASANSFAQNTWVKWNGHIFLKQGTDSTYWGDDAVLSTLPTIVSSSSIKTINGNTLLGSGNLVIGGSTSWGGITGTLSDQTDLQTALNLKLAANGNGSSLTGLTAAQVGLGNVTNESKATMFASPTFTGTISGVTKSMVGLANADNTSDANKPVSSATQTALDLKANLASPTFTGTVAGITASMVGLGNVTNESKATMFTSPTFTGTVSGVTASMVGLGNVNNTSDASKPISTATQSALDAKQATLVSATNIKTINGASVLGSGDLVVTGAAAWGSVTGTLSSQSDLVSALSAKDNTDLLAYAALGSAIKSETVGQKLQYANVATNLVDGQIKYTAVYLQNAATITGVKFYVRTLGVYTGDNNNRVGLYSYNNTNGNLTLVASSANSATLWTSAANAIQTVPFSSTYAAAAGIYFVAYIYNQSAQTTAPGLASGVALNNLAMSSTAMGFTNSAKLHGTSTGTDLPASILSSAITASAIPSWVSLY